MAVPTGPVRPVIRYVKMCRFVGENTMMRIPTMNSTTPPAKTLFAILLLTVSTSGTLGGPVPR